MPAVLTGVLVVPLTPAVPDVPVAPTWPEVPACVFPLMLPAVLGVWLEVLVEGYWLELALLDVCGVVVLVALDGYCEVELAVPLMLPLVPAFELDVLGVLSVVLVVEEEVVVVCSLEVDEIGR